MKKTTIIFIAIILIMVVAIPFTYILFVDLRPAIGDFFGGLSQSATVLFTGFSEQFMQLPYWVAIFGGICILFGIGFDRYWQGVWQRMKTWGYKETARPMFLNNPQNYQPPQPIAPNTVAQQPQQPPPVIKKELENQ